MCSFGRVGGGDVMHVYIFTEVGGIVMYVHVYNFDEIQWVSGGGGCQYMCILLREWDGCCFLRGGGRVLME